MEPIGQLLTRKEFHYADDKIDTLELAGAIIIHRALIVQDEKYEITLLYANPPILALSSYSAPYGHWRLSSYLQDAYQVKDFFKFHFDKNAFSRQA